MLYCMGLRPQPTLIQLNLTDSDSEENVLVSKQVEMSSAPASCGWGRVPPGLQPVSPSGCLESPPRSRPPFLNLHPLAAFCCFLFFQVRVSFGPVSVSFVLLLRLVLFLPSACSLRGNPLSPRCFPSTVCSEISVTEKHGSKDAARTRLNPSRGCKKPSADEPSHGSVYYPSAQLFISTTISFILP